MEGGPPVIKSREGKKLVVFLGPCLLQALMSQLFDRREQDKDLNLAYSNAIKGCYDVAVLLEVSFNWGWTCGD